MKPSLRCLIVDDEPRARAFLRKRLLPHPELVIVGEAGDIAEAHQLCLTLRPEVVFLDIRMPEADGFELIPLLQPLPQIVFVTAYTDRAYDAFQVSALDYLLKPYSAERMAQTVDKLLGRVTESGTSEAALAPVELAPDASIMVRTDTLLLRLNLAEMVLIEAEEPYTRLTLTSGKTYLLSHTMKAWEELLPSVMFSRLDRFHIINLKKVVSFDPQSRDMAEVNLAGLKRTIQIGRTAAIRLRQQLRLEIIR
jgi:two-component system LytT family response regulator